MDALISIGGDDTLKTANKFKLFQEQLPQGSKRIPVVHLPKTIDNDYSGIDFTFGYFTAVDVLAEEIRNLLADAEADRAYFIAETMGRSAGWLAYGVAIAGEASLVISVEDITGKYEMSEEITDPKSGKTTLRRVMDLDEVVNRIVATMRVREEVEGKEFGVIIVAEGPGRVSAHQAYRGRAPRRARPHRDRQNQPQPACSPTWWARNTPSKPDKKRKITGLQLGYESRCARPRPSTSCWAANSAWEHIGHWSKNASTA